VHPDLDAGFDFDEARLGWRKSDAAREEEAGQGLPMSAAQAAARDESRRFRLHSLHCMILNGDRHRRSRLSQRSYSNANF